MRVHAIAPIVLQAAQDELTTAAHAVDWLGPYGLADDLWERILQQADLKTWWRATGACKELRTCARQPAVMRAQLAQLGVGHLRVGAATQLTAPSLLAGMRRRLALERNLTARGLCIDIPYVATTDSAGPKWALALAGGKLLRGKANGEVEQLCVLPPPQRRHDLPALPPLVIDDAQVSSSLTTLGGDFFHHATPRRLTWWAAHRLEAPAGILRAPDNDSIVNASVADDGRLGGGILASGAVRLATAASLGEQASWQWQPGDAFCGRAPVPLDLALPRGGDVVLVLQLGAQAVPSLSCWRLVGPDVLFIWGTPALADHAPQGAPIPLRLALEAGMGMLSLAPDERHVLGVAVTATQEGDAKTSSPPIILSLDKGLAPLGLPSPLRLATRDEGEGEGEDESHVVWSPSGRELLVCLHAQPCDFVRRWEVGDGLGQAPRVTHTFGGGNGAISHLAISGDGVRVALARPGGRVEMWRMDSPVAELCWTFKPGHANYLSVNFVAHDDVLLLALRGGGVVSLDLSADIPHAATDWMAEVATGQPLRGLNEIHLSSADVARLRPS